MVFSSFSFLFAFLPLLIAVYYIMPVRFRSGRNVILLGFSLFFYAYGEPAFLKLMLLSITINYIFGILVDKRFSARVRKWLAAASAAANLALLVYFKYAMFGVENLNRLGLGLPVLQITLPIGISFFTFQGMSYVLDVYRGDAATQRNPLRVALYIALFPQLVAGPIVRYRTVAEEIRDRKESMEDFARGGARFAFGLAKKMLLANYLGAMADEIFATAAGDLTVTLAWLGALAYTGQIYFDFSGYSDMAIGLGRMFGFHFLENFNYPYRSKSVSEFWRRWHISLSTWFRDYVYIPLGGSRCAKGRQARNLVAVFLLTGLWHGAAWNFVIWGLYYAALLLCERFAWGRKLDQAPGPLRHGYTMLLVIIGWVLFRADTLGYAMGMAGAMFGGAACLWDGRTVYYLKEYGWALVLGIAAALPLKQKVEALLARHADSPLAGFVHSWGLYGLALALLALSYLQLLGSAFNPFIYFRF